MTTKTPMTGDVEGAIRFAQKIVDGVDFGVNLKHTGMAFDNLARCYLALEQSLRDLRAKMGAEYWHKETCACLHPGDRECSCGIEALLDELDEYPRERKPLPLIVGYALVSIDTAGAEVRSFYHTESGARQAQLEEAPARITTRIAPLMLAPEAAVKDAAAKAVGEK